MSPSQILGYAVSGITFVSGISVILGLILPERIPSQLQIMFGIVLLLLGIYRFAITQLRSRQQRARHE